MEAYCLHLTGVGETEIKFVNKETWDWINNQIPVSESQIEKYCKEYNVSKDEAVKTLNEWGGSCPENDRALMAVSDFGDTYFSLKEMHSFLKESGLNIIDTYNGGIY